MGRKNPAAWFRHPLFARMWLAGCPVNSIAKMFGDRSIMHVGQAAGWLGLPRRGRGRKLATGRHWGLWTDEERELVNYLFDGETPPEIIAENVGRTANAVRFELRQSGENFGARNRKHQVYRRKEQAELAEARAPFRPRTTSLICKV